MFWYLFYFNSGPSTETSNLIKKEIDIFSSYNLQTLTKSINSKIRFNDFFFVPKELCTFILSFFLFFSVLRPFQDYFSSNETGQSVGWTKMGEPRGKTPGTPASRTWLVPHVARAGLEPTQDTAVR